MSWQASMFKNTKTFLRLKNSERWWLMLAMRREYAALKAENSRLRRRLARAKNLIRQCADVMQSDSD